MTDMANPFLTDVLRGVEDRARSRGHHVHSTNSAFRDTREDDQLTLLKQQRVRGVVWVPIGATGERAAGLQRRGTSVVVVGQPADGADCCSASVDDVEGGRLTTQHLLDLGHTSIAVVGGQTNLCQVHDRRAGAALARDEHRGQVSLLIVPTSPTEADEVAGSAAATQLAALPDHQRPTAVFALNDLLAIGLLQGFASHRLGVPADVAVIGYDDIAFAASASVALSSIRQPGVELGRRAADLLLGEIEAKDADRAHQHQHAVFAPELVIRRSTRGEGPHRPRDLT